MKFTQYIFGIVILLPLLINYSDAKIRRITGEWADAFKSVAELIDNTIEDGVKILIPGIVRLAFHDCIDGCDACLDLNHPENRGLQKIVDLLETDYINYVGKISRSDYWLLASKYALEESVRLNNARCEERFPEPEDVSSCLMPSEYRITRHFRHLTFNRADCPTSPMKNTTVDMPSAKMDHQEILEWFDKTFPTLGPKGIVAIMGVHSLGRARPENSGFDGCWDCSNQDGMSNDWYPKQNVRFGWYQEDVANVTGSPHPMIQWKNTNDPNLFALTADRAIRRDFVGDPETGAVDCRAGSECGRRTRGPLNGMMSRYAASKDLWVHHFSVRFFLGIMTNGVTIN